MHAYTVYIIYPPNPLQAHYSATAIALNYITALSPSDLY